MALWYDEVFRDQLRFGMQVTRTLFSGKSAYQTVEILETERFGRVLVNDGLFMTSEADEHYYHEMLVHPALTTAPAAKQVLIIGGGDGGTAREVLRHPEVERVLIVEIDEMVVKACKEHLPTIGSAWSDPRLELRIGDGVAFVKNSEAEQFDVVLLDGTDPVGPAVGLFEKDFYADIRRVLRPKGSFALQSESPFLFREEFLEIQRRLGELFEGVHPYFGPVPIYASGQWSWTLASDAADPMHPRPERQAIAERTGKYYNADIHRAAFAVPNDIRRALRE